MGLTKQEINYINEISYLLEKREMILKSITTKYWLIAESEHNLYGIIRDIDKTVCELSLKYQLHQEEIKKIHQQIDEHQMDTVQKIVTKAVLETINH